MIHGWMWFVIFLIAGILVIFFVDFLEANEEPEVCEWCGGEMRRDNWKKGLFCKDCGKGEDEQNTKY